jgi:20S proteasome alpha/beta subunit
VKMFSIGPASAWRLVVVSLFVLLFARTEGAHSRRRPIVRYGGQNIKYDRSITTFSSDGRLQQVEYGLEAANRGESVVAALVNESVAIILVRGTHGSDKIHRIDSHILLATAGLAGDGRYLASLLRSACQRHLLSYGEVPTVEEVAEYAAQYQHDLTKTPGARPLGCTAIVIGVSNSRGRNTIGELQIFQTDPGGVLEQCTYCVAGKRNLQILKTLRECYRENDDNPCSTANNLVSKVLVSLTYGESGDSAGRTDLWVVRAEDGKRGNMGILCAEGIPAHQPLDAELLFL